MKKKSELDPLAPRRDPAFGKGAGGKYANAIMHETNIATVDPDLLETFRDYQLANEALRGLKKPPKRQL